MTAPSWLTEKQEAWAQRRAVEKCRQIEPPEFQPCSGKSCERPREGWQTCTYLFVARIVAQSVTGPDLDE